MVNIWAARYYKKTKQGYKKRLPRCIKTFLKEKEMKSSNMVAKDRATTLEMENKGWLNKKKVITKHRKVSRNNFQM